MRTVNLVDLLICHIHIMADQWRLVKPIMNANLLGTADQIATASQIKRL